MKLSTPVIAAVFGSASAFAPLALNARTQTSLDSRKPFITGNWKLNPQTKEEAIDLATGVAAAYTSDSPCDAAIFVPFPFIETVQKVCGEKIAVGAEVRPMFTTVYQRKWPILTVICVFCTPKRWLLQKPAVLSLEGFPLKC